MADNTDGRLYDNGDVIKTDKGTFEVTGVSRHEVDPAYFTYQLREQGELDAERERVKEAEEAAIEAQKASEAAAAEREAALEG